MNGNISYIVRNLGDLRNRKFGDKIYIWRTGDEGRLVEREIRIENNGDHSLEFGISTKLKEKNIIRHYIIAKGWDGPYVTHNTLI
jgi:hypothetical protein|tara:strand:- start:160 stop:414 length:255 start_codon:yes stop_codon:yes gene_type:complete